MVTKQKEEEMKHIISFSGGKDSSAMLFRMLELGMQIDEVIFEDTTREFKEMYDYIDMVEEFLQENFNIKMIRTLPKKSWDHWFYGEIGLPQNKIPNENTGKQRGYPLTYFPCWWQRESKVNPSKKICKGNLTYLGYATDEVKRLKPRDGQRYILAEWGWTEKDCLDYLDKIGMSTQLHHRFNRTGCWDCPKQPTDSLKTLCKYYPDKWSELKKLDKSCPKGFKKGVDLEVLEKEVYDENYCS